MFKLNEVDEGLIYSSYDGNKDNSIYFKIVKKALRTNDILRFYEITFLEYVDEFDYNNLFILLNDNEKIFFSSLTMGYSDSLGLYFDLEANTLGCGCHKLCLKYENHSSSPLQIFIMDKDNVLDFNVCFATEFNKNTSGFFTGPGQFIESSTEWSYQGERSLKITRIDDSFIWTDIPINIMFEGDSLFAEVTIKNDCDLSVFFVFFDENDKESYSSSINLQKSNFPQTITLNGEVSKNIKRAHLRFHIADKLGSCFYIDDIKIHNYKVNVAIYGSCAIKDPFTSLFNKDYKSEICAKINDQRHSLISSLQHKENIDYSLLEIEPEYNGSNFVTKCLIEDFNKNFIHLLLSETIDYIVMDVFFEIDFGVVLFNGDKIITNAKGFENTPLYKKIHNIRPLNMFNNPDVFFKLWTEYCDKFFEFLNCYCPNIKVVLAEVRTLDYVERDDGSIYQEHSFSDKVQAYNPLIIKLENYIKENYDVDVIPFSNDTLCADQHVWGKWFVHYHDKYYRNFLQCFKEIVRKNSTEE